MKKIISLLSSVFKRFSKPEPVTVPEIASPDLKFVRYFADVLKEYIDKYVVENTLTEETKNRYDVYYRNTMLFFASNSLQLLPFEDFKIKHAEQFRVWLRMNLKTCSIRHASRHVELLKRVTRYAVIMEYTVNDNLQSIKCQRDKPNKIVYLTLNEVKKLQVYNFHSDILRIVADLFMFQCFTGLSYSDIYKYTITDQYGKLWIEGARSKSEEQYVVYFFPEAKEILAKYQGKLPKLSNQKYNEFLKEVAALLTIPKKLTTHVGRKTHSALLSERGVSTKSISLTLGNTERVCEETYIPKTYKIIDNEITRLGLEAGLMTGTH
jgi:integrase